MAPGNEDPVEVTVLVTAYNRTEYLEKALASVLRQDVDPSRFELLLLSNVPQHGRLLEGFREPHPSARLRFLRVGESSIGEMLELGVEASRGRVICLLNDDDEWVPTKLSRVLSTFRSHPRLVYVWNGVQRISAKGEPLQTKGRFAASGLPSGQEAVVEGGHPAELLQILRWRSIGFNDSSVSVLRETVTKFLPQLRTILTNEDSFLLYASAVSGGQLLFLDDPLTRYRVHGGGMSQASNSGVSETWEKLVQNDRRELAAWRVIRDMVVSRGRSDLLPLVSREEAFAHLVMVSRDVGTSRGEVARRIVAFLPHLTKMRRWPGALALAWSLLALFSRGFSHRAYLTSVHIQSER